MDDSHFCHVRHGRSHKTVIPINIDANHKRARPHKGVLILFLQTPIPTTQTDQIYSKNANKRATNLQSHANR